MTEKIPTVDIHWLKMCLPADGPAENQGRPVVSRLCGCAWKMAETFTSLQLARVAVPHWRPGSVD